MIYILTGNDTKKKNAYLKKLCESEQPLFVSETNISKEELFDQAQSLSLFGGSPVVVVENFIKEGEVSLSEKDQLVLKDSKTVFVFLEDKLLATDLKKYKKYSDVEDFSVTVSKQISKTNIFGIADAYAKKDKIGTWVLYREAILSGASPEEISGILFWKI
jgi:DNA polymerase III delta subunit